MQRTSVPNDDDDGTSPDRWSGLSGWSLVNYLVVGTAWLPASWSAPPGVPAIQGTDLLGLAPDIVGINEVTVWSPLNARQEHSPEVAPVHLPMQSHRLHACVFVCSHTPVFEFKRLPCQILSREPDPHHL
jgi:hypothetical protein